MKFNKLLEESQFHGGRRLAKEKSSLSRWYWSIFMLVLFGAAVSVICATVGRFFDNPTYMVYQESVENATKFPSVLVCPEIFYRADKIDRFLHRVSIPPHLNISYLKDVIYTLAAFYSPDMIYKTHDLENVEQLLKYNQLDVDTVARYLTTSCKRTLMRCRWNGVIVNCSSLFHMELTGVGYCCVFNGRSLRDLHDIHHHNHEVKQYYTNRYGHDSGLMLAVNQSQRPCDVDLSYKWLAIQPSQHFVESPVNGSALNPGSEHWMEYQLMNFQIADDARSLSNSLKRCRMANEPSKFFPVYHKQYCGVECEVEVTLRRCKCVRLVHPRTKGTQRCAAHQLLCAKHAMVSGDEDDCHCPQACDVATDLVKTTTFTLQPSVRPVDTFYEGLNFKKVTVVRVFVMNGLVRTNSRWSYFTNIDLFAQLGGVFNVFFGCSILTLLELAVLGYRGLVQRLSAVSKSGANVSSDQRQRGNKGGRISKNRKKTVKPPFKPFNE